MEDIYVVPLSELVKEFCFAVEYAASDYDSVRVTVIATGLTADYKDSRPSTGKNESDADTATPINIRGWDDEDDDLMEITRIFDRRKADMTEE